MKYGLVLKGKIVQEDKLFLGQIGIDNGKIMKISSTKEELLGKEKIDYGNNYIFPGFIDTHVHCFSNPEEGITKTSKLAAAGGITTFIDMPYDSPSPITNVDRFEKKANLVNKESVVDIGLWGTITKENGTSNLKPLIKSGAIAFKMSTFETDEKRFPEIPNYEIVKAMEILATTNTLVAFHSEDNNLVQSLIKNHLEEDKVYPLAHAETHPAYTEVISVLKLLELAYWTKVKLHIVHVSHPRTLDIINIFKKMGVNVTAETCYPYLLLNTNDLDEYGPFAKMSPPVRSADDVKKMWEHLKQGNIDFITSDHVFWDEIDKEKGINNIFEAPAGLPGLEVMIPLMFDAMVINNNFTPSEFSKIMSTNPANRFGIPNKGKIKEGYDADFTIIDPNKEWEISSNTLLFTNPKLLPFKSKNIKGKIKNTFVRGISVFDGKKVNVQPGFGNFIHK